MSTHDRSQPALERAIVVDERHTESVRLGRQLAALVMADFVIVGALLGWLAGVFVGATLWLIVAGALAAGAAGWFALKWRGAWLVALCQKTMRSGPAATSAAGGDLATQRAAELTGALAQLCLTVGVSEPDVVVVDDPSINLATVGLDRYDWTLLVTRGLLDSDTLAEPAVAEGLLAGAVTRVADGSAARSTATLSAAMLLTAGGWRVASNPAERWWHTPIRVVMAPVRRLWVRGVTHVDDLANDAAALNVTRYPPGLIAAYEAAQQAGPTSADPAFGPLWLIDPAAQPNRPDLAQRIRVLHLY